MIRNAAALPDAATPIGSGDTGLLDALRLATAVRHEALDALFPDGFSDRGRYVGYLQAMAALVDGLDAGAASGLDPAWQPWHSPGRLRALGADLGRLDRPLRTFPGAALSATRWIGACYVLEGSTLGARWLLRQARRLAERDDAVRPAVSFLELHAGDTGRWPAFLRALGTVPVDRHADAIDGATLAFDVTHSIIAESITA